MKYCFINYSRTGTTNRGDLLCCPSDYFKFDEVVHCSPHAQELPKGCAAVVVGGGAVLSEPNLKRLAETDRTIPFYVWGAGATYKNNQDVPKEYEYWVDRCHVFAPRESLLGYFNCPCASVFKIADIPIASTRRGIERIYNPHKTKNKDGISNHSKIEDILSCIDSKLLVTNSYHAAYWHSLRAPHPPIIEAPYSSKFYNTPFDTVVLSRGSGMRKAMDSAIRTRQNPHMLKYAIDRNRRVYELIKIGVRMRATKHFLTMFKRTSDEVCILLYGPSLNPSMSPLPYVNKGMDIWVCNEWRKLLPFIVYPTLEFYLDDGPKKRHLNNRWAKAVIAKNELVPYAERDFVMHLGIDNSTTYTKPLYTKYFSGDWMLECALLAGYKKVHMVGWSCTQDTQYNRSSDGLSINFNKSTLDMQEKGIRSMCDAIPSAKERVILHGEDNSHRFAEYFTLNS